MNQHDQRDDRATPPPPEQPIELGELLERCMGNADVATLLLRKFEEQARRDMGEIARQFAAEDSARLAQTAHALKGAAGAVAAGALRDRAARIEACAREGRLAAIADDVASLRSDVERCLSQLPAARVALAGRSGVGAAGTESSR